MAAVGTSGLIGKAGEYLVASELLRRGIDVAWPAWDSGIDMLAYQQERPGFVVPIQVKTQARAGYAFERKWFDIAGIVLVQIYRLTETPEVYIFGRVAEVEGALGEKSVKSEAWVFDGKYSSPAPVGVDRMARMQPFRNAWATITNLFPARQTWRAATVTSHGIHK